MTRNRVLGMDEDDYTFDTKGKTSHTPGGTFTAEDITNSSGKDSVELRIIQQLLSKEHLLSPREEIVCQQSLSIKHISFLIFFSRIDKTRVCGSNRRRD